MAAPEKKDGPGFPVAIVATMLVALAGLIVGQWQLVGMRPPASEVGGYPPGPLQDVPGRLWQDPFGVVDQHLKRVKTAPPDQDSPPPLSGSQRLGRLQIRLREPGPTTDILGVMVFGGDYTEYAEQRRRTRYAVVSGLSSEGFVPEEPEALGYFKPAGGSMRQAQVPFEWFQHEGSRRQVLLLWLDENALGNKTAFSQLSRLATSLRVSSGKRQARVTILGPVASGTLEALVTEMKQNPTRAAGVRFFSSATGAAGLQDALPASVHRVIATDDTLMASLIRELRLRRVDPARKAQPDRVVLVSEWDTSYGRALPKAFERAVCNAGALCLDARAPWVHSFSYLRGLDGQIPGGQRPESKSSGDKTQPDGDRTSGPFERAEGQGQFDYLRRLAARVQEVAEDRRGGEGGGEIKAIGVLGSDVYDKSLVLQAFRNEFPKAILFTTDLDARMLHPVDYRWTRNLLVASGFGLALHPDRQRNIPPFRDSYQTATFFATQQALQAEQPGQAMTIPPRLFEIARSRAFDLSPDAPGRIHPKAPRLLPHPGGWPLFAGVWIAILSPILLYLASPRLRDRADGLLRWVRAEWRRRKVRFAACVLACAVLVSAAGVWIVREGQAGVGEPFLLLSGVSLWPTEVIRLVAATLSASFLVSLWQRIHRVPERLKHEFGEMPADTRRRPVARSWLRRMVAALRDKELDQRLPEGQRYEATALWADYLKQASFRSQCRRVLPALVLFLVFCYLVVSLDMPHAPSRGVSALMINRVIVTLGILLLAWLILAVSDTIRLAEKYLDMFGKSEPTIWPEPISTTAGDFLGIPLAPGVPLEKIKRRCVGHWLDIRMIEMWTDVISPVIYYPFIVLCLIFLARSPLFDNWITPYPLMLVFGLSAAYAATCAFKLRHVAERARARALDRFTYLLVNAKGEGGSPPLAGQIETMIKEIQTLHRGAFAPFTEQPVVRALLLPVSSVGGMSLLLHYLGWGEW